MMAVFAAWLATLVLGGLALLQLALACGAPLGRFVWGGQHVLLPLALRVGSAVSIVLYGVFALVLLSKAGAIESPLSSAVHATGAWLLCGYFLLGVVVNAVSRSRAERYVMTPVVAVLAATTYIVASS